MHEGLTEADMLLRLWFQAIHQASLRLCSLGQNLHHEHERFLVSDGTEDVCQLQSRDLGMTTSNEEKLRT